MSINDSDCIIDLCDQSITHVFQKSAVQNDVLKIRFQMTTYISDEIQQNQIGTAPTKGKRGIPIIRISHNMPHVCEFADRIHIRRLGKRLGVIYQTDYTMSDAVAFMTGAKEPLEAQAS